MEGIQADSLGMEGIQADSLGIEGIRGNPLGMVGVQVNSEWIRAFRPDSDLSLVIKI